MKENKKKNNIKGIIATIILLGLVLSAAYAYFSSNPYVLGANSTTNLAIEDAEFNLTLSTGSTLSLNIDALNPENSTVVGHSTVSGDTVTLNSSSNEKNSICYYDIYYTPTGDTFHNSHNNTEQELVITGSESSNQNKELIFDLNGVSSKTKMFEGFVYTDSENSNVTQTWTFNLVHYNLSDVNQEEHLNHSYSGQISFEAKDCHKIAIVDTIIAKGNGSAGGHPGAMIEDHGIRYIGENPSNFVWFNCSDLTNQNASTCERWRIIGVFNEKYDTDGDNKPDTEGDLVKIIRNDSLGTYSWDYKQSGVGSSTTSSGSNDWSDSQLMMMLNPPEFINSGYINESDVAPVHSNTIDNEGYVVSNGINIFKNMGSYFNSSLTAYKPYSTYTTGYGKTSSGSYVTESSLLASSTFTRMTPLSQDMIATVKWYLTGIYAGSDGLYDTTVSQVYNSERNINNTGYAYTGWPKIWYGKIGLMYPSDYGYATNGTLSTSENGVVLTRDECLTRGLGEWRVNETRLGYAATYGYYNCSATDWLLYVGATGNTTATKGSATTQWALTIFPSSVNDRHDYQSYVSSSGYVTNVRVTSSYNVRSVLYIEPKIRILGGSGTYDSPYSLSM